MENKQDFLAILESSSLNAEDKEEWKSFFDLSSEEMRKNYTEILSAFPQEIEWFNSILKRKKAMFALMEKDKAKGEEELQKIIEEEKLKIQELIK